MAVKKAFKNGPKTIGCMIGSVNGGDLRSAGLSLMRYDVAAR